MNMQNLMAQAQKMQRDMQKITKELEEKEYTEANEVLEIKMNGKREVLELNILDDDILTDKEMLEDMLTASLSNILKAIDKEKEAKLGKYTNGLGGLF